MRFPERMTSAAKTNSASPSSIGDLSSAAPTKDQALGEVVRSRRRSGFAETSDGIRLFFEVTGEAPGQQPPKPTLLLCDGLGCDGYVWKYLQWALAPAYQIVHFHYRGHGYSALPAELPRVRLSDFVRDAFTVLDACSIRSAVFCGHSMGVQVALESYRQAKERVAGLVLVCGSYGNPLRTFKGSDRLETLLPLVRAGVSRMPALFGAVWRRAIPTELSYYLAQRIEIDGQLVRREDFFPYLEGIARMDPRMFLCTLAAAGQHSARALLPSIAVPTLIIAGRRDSFTPMTLSEEMRGAIPHSKLYIVEQGTHTAPIERPAEVTEVMADFLRQRLFTQEEPT